MSTIIRGSGDTTFGGTIQSTGIDDNATSTAITIDSNENLIVGATTASSYYKLSVFGPVQARNDTLVTDSASLAALSGTSGLSQLNLGDSNDGDAGAIHYDNAVDGMKFRTNAAERMRIDSAGNVLVGTTTNAPTTTDGINLGANNKLHATRNGGVSGYFNRRTNDGGIVEFAQDGSTVGNIGSLGDTIYVAGASGGIRLLSNQWRPVDNAGNASDNTTDIGQINVRLDDIYATNGTIQTSDRNEKQDIEELTEAEQRVAVACKGLLRKFRWQDAVAEKGDDARIHFGIIAQDLQDAFAAEGLDAGDYAMFISTTWYEKEVEVPAVEAVEAVEATYDDEGAELTPAVEAVEAKDAYTRTDTEDEPTDGYTERTRLGVRYPELLAFIISAI
jgi:hypothetical protein